jgi:hypothetical protein
VVVIMAAAKAGPVAEAAAATAPKLVRRSVAASLLVGHCRTGKCSDGDKGKKSIAKHFGHLDSSV